MIVAPSGSSAESTAETDPLVPLASWVPSAIDVEATTGSKVTTTVVFAPAAPVARAPPLLKSLPPPLGAS